MGKDDKKKERIKNPRVPNYPEALLPQIAELERDLAAGDTTAYPVLTRLAVLHSGLEPSDRYAVEMWIRENY